MFKGSVPWFAMALIAGCSDGSISARNDCANGNEPGCAAGDACSGPSCVVDCANVAGGTAFVDSCGTCVAGSTGLQPCENSDLSEQPLPGGEASLTIQWHVMAGATGYVVYIATSSQLFPEPDRYPYRYLIATGTTTQLTLQNVAAGSKFVRVGAIEGSTVGDLSHELEFTP